MLQTFSATEFRDLCDRLAAIDPDLANIIKIHGYPPLWSRPNNFETLVHIILEQQVSLASAKSALEKLRVRIDIITPQNVLTLSDETLRACYFSRQKSDYVRQLAQALNEGNINLARLEVLSDEDVRSALTSLKGIGNWTVDIYLIMVLHRSNIFPFGDLAAVNALKRLKHLPKAASQGQLAAITDKWQPYRTVATMLLWHYYLSSRARLVT